MKNVMLLIKNQVENEHTATWRSNSQLYDTHPPLTSTRALLSIEYYAKEDWAWAMIWGFLHSNYDKSGVGLSYSVQQPRSDATSALELLTGKSSNAAPYVEITAARSSNVMSVFKGVDTYIHIIRVELQYWVLVNLISHVRFWLQIMQLENPLEESIHNTGTIQGSYNHPSSVNS